ncbi:MAG: FlgD immunoglobulin-like domain containing protein [Eubacteriales bacterium]|nr:FlgD immunoglobulin-like domain containing protein [Eubacteriales bacterium]
MRTTLRTVRRIFILCMLALALAACFCVASAQISRTGYISTFRLLEGEPVFGEDTHYKLSIRKGGQVVAELTDLSTGEKALVLDRAYSSGANILLTVPGELIAPERSYALSVRHLYDGRVIGEASHTFAATLPAARIDALSVTSSFRPQEGETLEVAFSLPDDAYVTAVVKNAGGAQAAVLASGAPMQAGEHRLQWNGFLADGSLAPGGSYTVELSCSNKGGASPVVSAAFLLSGDTEQVLSGRVQGSIRSLLLPERPEDSRSPVFVLNADRAGRYTLKLRDMATGYSVKMTGELRPGANRIAIDMPLTGGHEYMLQIIEQVSGSTVGKGQIGFVAWIDRPSVSISAPASLRAGYGAALPITYTTGTTSSITLFLTDEARANTYWSATLDGLPAGTGVYHWNGRAADGSLLPEGDYLLHCESTNAAGRASAAPLSLSYEGEIDRYGVPTTQGAITFFAPAGDPTPAERTSVRMRVRTSTEGTLKLTLRDVTNDGRAVLVFNAYVSAGEKIVTIPAEYFRANSYEVQAGLYVKNQLAGKANAFLQPRIVPPEVTGFQCSDTFESKWGHAYDFSFDLASTGYLHVRVEDPAKQTIVRYLSNSEYCSAGHYAFSWDGCDESGNMVPPGDYQIVVAYVDCYETTSNFVVHPLRFEGPQYPEGVYGYAIVGRGTHKTPIHIYREPNGSTFAVTYGISAAFEVLEDLGDWLLVRTSGTVGTPVVGYVKADRLQKIAITSPYRIEVNIARSGPNKQTMYVYKDGALIDRFKISSGKAAGSTPTGVFNLNNRKPYFTVLGGGGICYDTLRVVGGVCIHRIPEIGGSYATTEPLLGSPASHGCIRVPVEKSTWLYEAIPDTTPIIIYSK